MLETAELNRLIVRKRLGLALYVVGIVLGIGAAVTMIWGDLEASLFDVTFRAERTLYSLRCPVLLSADEETAVSATFHNDKEREENILVRAHISSGFLTLIREEEMRLTLPPNSSETLSWAISPDDAAWGRIVMVRVGAVQRLPYPRLVGASCGAMLLPFRGLNGTTFLALFLVGTAGLIVSGGWLWGLGRRQLKGAEKKTQRQMIVALVLLVGALLLGGFGQWLPGLGLLIGILIYYASGLEQFATLNRR